MDESRQPASGRRRYRVQAIATRDDRIVERVIRPGPIPYSEIAQYGDPDLAHGLRHYGVEPETTSFRLLEVPMASISDTASMPHRVRDRSIVEAVRAGVELPPLVVFRHHQGNRRGLPDGVNRTNAFVLLGVPTTRAYEAWASARARAAAPRGP